MSEHKIRCEFFIAAEKAIQTNNTQWSFLVPLIGGRYHIIPQLAVYTTYIPLIYCLLYITYHLLREPETAIEIPIRYIYSYMNA